MTSAAAERGPGYNEQSPAANRRRHPLDRVATQEETPVPALLRSAAPYVVRQLPAPRWEPPYDDESSEVAGSPRAGDGIQGTLALSFARLSCPAGASERVLRLLPSPGPAESAGGTEATTARVFPPAAGARPARPARGGGDGDGDDELDLARRRPVRTDRDQLPDPQPWARGFVQALTEVLGGFRPLGQLTARTVPSVAALVADLRTGSSALPARQRAVVRSVRVSEPAPGAVEVSATVRHGDRCRALALRLEGLDGRWQCTALIVG